MVAYTTFLDLLDKASSAVAFVVGQGEHFVEEGIREMDESLLPELKNTLSAPAIPRVLQSYGILMWLTIEVRISINLLNSPLESCNQLCITYYLDHKSCRNGVMREELLEHFAQKMVPHIARLQPAPKPTQQASVAGAASLAALGKEILECCQSLNLYHAGKKNTPSALVAYTYAIACMMFYKGAAYTCTP